jgi:homogentisate 1,2-dioxygenase
VLHGAHASVEIREWLDSRGVKRPALITGPSRRHLASIEEALEGLELAVFDGATVHVPREVVDSARKVLDAHSADAIITVGGGSATGLGKALRLELDVPFVALPTTYSASEMTGIYGILEGKQKNTGRDERVRPDLVAYLPASFRALPRDLRVQSLLNALAHPISALSTGKLDPHQKTQALGAVSDLFGVLRRVGDSGDAALGRAARAAARGGQVLDGAKMGTHHVVAHQLGGRFGLPHAPLHALLLPQFFESLRRSQPGIFGEIVAAVHHSDPLAMLFDALVRVGAPTSLAGLDLEWPDVESAGRERLTDEDLRWVKAAFLGRRPSLLTRRECWDGTEVALRGPAPEEADRIIIAVHGRGATSDGIVQRARELTGDAPGICIVAPQANGTAWYAGSYREAPAALGSAFEDAIAAVEGVINTICERARHGAKRFLFGFSQGACLTLEVFARTSSHISGVVALAGSRIGPRSDWAAIDRKVDDLPVLLGVSHGDRWLDLADVQATARQLEAAGAKVSLVLEPGDAHSMSGQQRARARELLIGEASSEAQWGFGNAHSSEALPGALPREQNTPRQAPYGLFAEQINGTGFIGPRHKNLRTWMYKIRPSAVASTYAPIDHATLSSDFDRPPEPSLVGYEPIAYPESPTDWVDGLHTFGGAGHPRLRRGFAIHLYVANRSMEQRSFTNSDGDMLIIPQDGELLLKTELGLLEVGPGRVAIIPRGIKFAVLLRGERARGWVGEVFGRHFELPDRGPIGANGLADARHFQAPNAWFEDRPDPGHRLTNRMGGALYETTLEHSPYDVVAWHGNYAPYVYDLSYFSPLSSVRIDHADPSIYLVLSAPLDEVGADSIDFVVFPPRWDATEHTFRPAYFHRNAVSEFNGIIRDASPAPFCAGAYFLTPTMTPHGVVASSVEKAIRMTDEEADKPLRSGDRSLWFQFETALPVSLTPWAEASENRQDDWPAVWSDYPTYFNPDEPDFDKTEEPD